MEQLIADIRSMAEEWGDIDVSTGEESLRIRMTPAPGLRTFLTVERNPAADFSTLCKVECCTLVGNVEAESDELFDFLDNANASAFEGAWEWFGNGDVGVTGQLLVANASDPQLPLLVGQLLALQVEDAIAVGRPEWSIGFEDLHDPYPPPVRFTLHRMPDLAELIEALRWRSSHHEAERWIVDEINADVATVIAPPFVNEAVRLDSGELSPGVRRLTIALATHPRRGSGVLLQVTLLGDVQEDAIRFRNAGVATQNGRWFGTGLGGLMLWSEEASTELAYRAFLPLDLLSIVDHDAATNLLVDAALGAVNATGVAEAIFNALAIADGPEAFEQAVEERQSALMRQYRVGALRAATHVRRQDDDLADADGPLVDVGSAVLDRLAVDQLKIGTAPHLLSDRGFAWLPGPHVQRVEATPMRPSRRIEITEVSVTTELGKVPLGSYSLIGQLCVELMKSLPLCSLVMSEDGEVQLTSRMTVHEGVWWHRAGLIAVVAALQLNCADDIRATLGVITNTCGCTT